MIQAEGFQPIPNTPSNSISGRLRSTVRMFRDLQLLTILRHLRGQLPLWNGTVLDVGCVASPWKYLLDPQKTHDTGIDISDAASKFACQNRDCLYFDVRHSPCQSASFDAILCTEVLEHLIDFQTLVSEMHRVLRPGRTILVMVPWSARWHYIPYDYFRYSRGAFQSIFAEFDSVVVTARGNDVAVMANKLLVMFARSLKYRSLSSIPRLLIAPVTGLIALFAILAAHASLPFGLGSADDPLGYAVMPTKRNP